MPSKKKQLSKLTISRLRAVSAAILREPHLYDQAEAHCTNRSCGSPSCIFGWAVTLFTRTRAYEGVAEIRGATALGLKPQSHSAEALYMPGRWPGSFIRAYEQAKAEGDHFTAACVAVARIEHFIRTDGAE